MFTLLFVNFLTHLHRHTCVFQPKWTCGSWVCLQTELDAVSVKLSWGGFNTLGSFQQFQHNWFDSFAQIQQMQQSVCEMVLFFKKLSLLHEKFLTGRRSWRETERKPLPAELMVVYEAFVLNINDFIFQTLCFFQPLRWKMCLFEKWSINFTILKNKQTAFLCK